MADSHRYVMLLSSLPYHGPLFGAKQTPLSRIRLDQRLELLEPEDARCLEILGQLLDWPKQDRERSDAEAMRWARGQVEAITHPFARALAVWRLEYRSLIAALRRRHRGEPAPLDAAWGFGRWLGQVRRNWSEPAFRLEGAFPWLGEANRRIETGDALGLERLLLGVVWSHLDRISDGHAFDFEAVVIYVMRWELIARWTSYDAEATERRFEALVEAGLAGTDLSRIAA
ncbi:DUF2764 family protein [Thiocystis violacea]|uniref:DUF2764 family protein n=1 Tax=Thiocystis violacea TaxID=13725 RepID=UPI001903D39D|nr:DUF2764 family protein [Thiocystis violacea]MBK1723929.1 hypothetical protein [Thiocystis violacea]